MNVFELLFKWYAQLTIYLTTLSTYERLQCVCIYVRVNWDMFWKDGVPFLVRTTIFLLASQSDRIWGRPKRVTDVVLGSKAAGM